MTNEEAIEVLKNDIEICTIQQEEAVDMAIKALEQQNKSEILTGSESEDCISREDALKAIEEQKKGFYGVERYAIDECHSAVLKLPSITPSYNSVKTELKPSEDFISRQAVKEMLTEEWTKYMPMESDVSLSFVLEKISELPSVTPKARWIPCSERLPEIDEEVLVFARCYFECSCYEEYIVKVRDACPEFCNGTNDNQLLAFGCKHGTCGNCEMENTGNDDKMFFTHMGVASRDKSDYWDSMDLSDDDVVIAWMPLPQPYKAESEE